MTTPQDLVGPQPRPSDHELAAMPTVRIPWQRPAQRRPSRPGAPLVVAALINTGWATFISLTAMILLVLTARFTLGQKPNGAEVTVALAGWLLAHGVPLTAPIGKLAVAPLAVSLLAAWRLSRA